MSSPVGAADRGSGCERGGGVRAVLLGVPGGGVNLGAQRAANGSVLVGAIIELGGIQRDSPMRGLGRVTEPAHKAAALP